MTRTEDAIQRSMVEWHAIPGFKGLYEVNHAGEIRSWPRWGSNNRRYGGGIIKPQMRGKYLGVNLHNHNKKKVPVSIHKIVCQTFHGLKPSTKHQVRHLNGNHLDNRADNLCWGTAKENSDDARQHGTLRIGTLNGMARLNPDKVCEIRSLRDQGLIHSDIGRLVSISRESVADVLACRTWKHVR